MDYSALTEAANATSVYRTRYQTIAKEIVAVDVLLGLKSKDSHLLKSKCAQFSPPLV